LLACAVDRWSVRQVKAWRFLSRDQDHPAPHAGARSSLLSHRAGGKRLQRARELGFGFEVVFAPTVSYRLTAPDLRRSEHHQRRRRAGSVALRSCITSIHLVITNHMWLEENAPAEASCIADETWLGLLLSGHRIALRRSSCSPNRFCCLVSIPCSVSPRPDHHSLHYAPQWLSRVGVGAKLV
jgi:hypothetical protein